MLDLLFLTLEVVGQVDADRARIQKHLEVVESELRARDTSHLPAELQAERERNLDRLHTYRLAGVFPQNPEFIGERVPFFIDADGVACAVGHLVIESGFAAVAEEIEARENNARLLDMTHPALTGWIAQSGLTAEECARIQPSYCGCSQEYEPVCGEDGKTYGNTCQAETCAMVKVAHEGVCAPAESTSDWPEPGSSTAVEDTSGSGSSGSSESSDGSGSSSSGEPDDEAKPRKAGCSLGQEGAGASALALLLLAMRRRRWRS